MQSITLGGLRAALFATLALALPALAQAPTRELAAAALPWPQSAAAPLKVSATLSVEQRLLLGEALGEDTLREVDALVARLHQRSLRGGRRGAAAAPAARPAAAGEPRMRTMSFVPASSADAAQDDSSEGDLAIDGDESSPVRTHPDGSLSLEHVANGADIKGEAKQEQWVRNGRTGATYTLKTRVYKDRPDGKRVDWSMEIREDTEFDYCPRPGGLAGGKSSGYQAVDVRMLPGNARIYFKGSHRADYTGRVDDAAELERIDAALQVDAEVINAYEGRRTGGNGAWPMRTTLTPVPYAHAQRDDPKDFVDLRVERPQVPDGAGGRMRLYRDEDRAGVEKIGGNALSSALNLVTLDAVVRNARSRWRNGECVELTALEGGPRVARVGETVPLKVRTSHKLGQPQAERLPIEASPQRARIDQPAVQPATASWAVRIVEPDARVYLESVSNRGIGTLVVNYGAARRLRITIEGQPSDMQDRDIPCVVRDVFEGELTPLPGGGGKLGGRWTQRHENFMCADLIIEADGQRDLKACFSRARVEMDAEATIKGRDPNAMLALKLRFRPGSLSMNDSCGLDEAAREFMREIPVIELPVVRLPGPGERRASQRLADDDGTVHVEWVR